MSRVLSKEMEKLKCQVVFQQLKKEVYSNFSNTNNLKAEQQKLQEENSLKIQIELCMKENSKNDISIADMKCELNKSTLT